ncbi:glycosyltransferase family 4 protein [Actinoplanes regularis]|uniref:Glycosyltransferase involved in cell wall bisynthesis n=1 Tax=Actinoplanes regularis TaxID=52697 RepID=A0A238X5P6_9ACTN|nr:glycosyltransferase family 4 protein [Actinoplanes regularis]GIE86484.1 LPS biosynthesis RfbU related protein [Actinoplanes regularis]SNR54356.1 Glycosyltransferase involved in cell wall bisynthesis [Actinoplanes regularis]
MRILQVVNIGYEAGGAERSVRLITDGLIERGHDVEVLATDLLSAGQRVFAHHLVPSIRGSAPRRFVRKLWYQQAYDRARAVLDDFEPDCVHLHTIGELSPSVLAATARIPRLLTVHGPEDWTLNLLRWNLASATGPGGLSVADRARYAYLRFVQRPAYLPKLRGIDRIITPSRYFADAVTPDVGAERTYVVPNGIERTARPTPIRDTANLLFVGRLEHVKGVEILLRAFREITKEHPRARLTIVGDGTDRERLETEFADLRSAGTVVFTGWLSSAAVTEQVSAASVVVLPSLWPENFPTVALEAMQAGRPMVASRVGGLPELVAEDNGVLVPPGDPAALATALNGLLGRADLLNRLGAASAARADRYDRDRFLDALEQHYREVCA